MIFYQLDCITTLKHNLLGPVNINYLEDTQIITQMHYLIKCEKVGLNHYNDPKAFIEQSNDMLKNDVRCKVLIGLDDIIADMINNKKLNPVVTELFIRDRKSSISLFCYTIIF